MLASHVANSSPIRARPPPVGGCRPVAVLRSKRCTGAELLRATSTEAKISGAGSSYPVTCSANAPQSRAHCLPELGAKPPSRLALVVVAQSAQPRQSWPSGSRTTQPKWADTGPSRTVTTRELRLRETDCREKPAPTHHRIGAVAARQYVAARAYASDTGSARQTWRAPHFVDRAVGMTQHESCEMLPTVAAALPQH